MKKVLSILITITLIFTAISSLVLETDASTEYANIVSIANSVHPGSPDFWLVVYTFDREVGPDHRQAFLFEINGINLSSQYGAPYVEFTPGYDNTNSVVIQIHFTKYNNYNLKGDQTDQFSFIPEKDNWSPGKEGDFNKVTALTTAEWGEGNWFSAWFTFESVVSDDYLNLNWFHVNGIRAINYAGTAAPVVVERFGTNGRGIALHLHIGIQGKYNIKKDSTDVFEFLPERVLYETDIAMPASPGNAIRGNIVLSRSGNIKSDIKNNNEAIILSFWSIGGGSSLRVGVHEVFTPSGHANTNLQVRRDILYTPNFNLKLTSNQKNQYMLYVNGMPVNDISWIGGTAGEIKTNNLLNGFNYSAVTGWEGHDGVIKFFNNMPLNLKVNYDKSTLNFTHSNEKIKNHEVSLKKVASNFYLDITNWRPDYSYQIWTYQDVFTDFGEQKSWVLAKQYTQGSLRGQNEFQLIDDNKIRISINDLTHVKNVYDVSVRIIDINGKIVGQLRDKYSSAEVGEVIISKVNVDGKLYEDRRIASEIKTNSTAQLEIITNLSANVTYNASFTTNRQDYTVIGTENSTSNSFVWNTSGLEPGKYIVKLTANHDETEYNKEVEFTLFKNDPSQIYGEISDIIVSGQVSGSNYQVIFQPQGISDEFINATSLNPIIRYSISEPWRPAIQGGSGMVAASNTNITNSALMNTQYGIYHVIARIARGAGSHVDDGIIRTIENKRNNDPKVINPGLQVKLQGDGAFDNLTEGTPVSKGSTIQFNPSATNLGEGTIQYSYWRRDARGWVLIKDYNSAVGDIGTLEWTPARIGNYTIQIRAKGQGAGSYEVIKNIEFEITDTSDSKANVLSENINLYGTENAKARTPSEIYSGAISSTQGEEDLLYKYIISNGYIYYVETAYSPDPFYTWVPSKAGTYRISVLVKNQTSFGKYDAVRSFEIQVNP